MCMSRGGGRVATPCHLPPDVLDLWSFEVLSKSTCLLLGAGASTHLGFPLGSELRLSILDELRRMTDQDVESLPATLQADAHRRKEFLDKLHHGIWPSPDAFLESYPRFMNLGKYLICRVLAKCERPYGAGNGTWGWYDHLVNAIHADSPSRLKDNRLSIVTFNYDRSLDFRLHMYVTHQFDVPESEGWQILQDSIPIVHLHGLLGEYPRWGIDSTNGVLERSRDIKIISEVADVTPEFEKASQLLHAADRVIVIGFGFAQRNVERLRFFDTVGNLEAPDIDVIVGDLSGAARFYMDTRLKAYGFKDHQIIYKSMIHHVHSTPNPFG